MRQIPITDFLTAKEIEKASKLFADCIKQRETRFALLCEAQIIRPAIDRINTTLGQDNDPRFLAYMVEYVMSLTRER